MIAIPPFPSSIFLSLISILSVSCVICLLSKLTYSACSVYLASIMFSVWSLLFKEQIGCCNNFSGYPHDFKGKITILIRFSSCANIHVHAKAYSKTDCVHINWLMLQLMCIRQLGSRILWDLTSQDRGVTHSVFIWLEWWLCAGWIIIYTPGKKIRKRRAVSSCRLYV